MPRETVVARASASTAADAPTAPAIRPAHHPVTAGKPAIVYHRRVGLRWVSPRGSKRPTPGSRVRAAASTGSPPTHPDGPGSPIHRSEAATRGSSDYLSKTHNLYYPFLSYIVG